jgi:nucleoside phosphorylase
LLSSNGKRRAWIEESAIVRDGFNLQQNIPETRYYIADLNVKHHDLVLRRATGQTNLLSAESTGEIIFDFAPEFILLIGTAGGYGNRDGLKLGDVVVSDYVEFSGYWKYKEDQVLRRKIAHDQPSLYLCDNFIEDLRGRPGSWRPHVRVVPPNPGEPSIHLGEIVSGDDLLGDPDNAEQRRILEFFDKGLGFEMEAVGVARAIYKARKWVGYNPQFIVIRGVSDLVNMNAAENQETRILWTQYAVSAATAVAKVLVERLLQAIKRRDAAGRGLFPRLRGIFSA